MRFIVFCVLVALAPIPAHAYLDPGTGSMIVQILIGAVAGGLVALKVYWHRLKRLLTGAPSDSRGGPDTDRK